MLSSSQCSTDSGHSTESDDNSPVHPSPLITTHSATSTLLQSDDSDTMANPLDWNSTPTFIKKHFPHWKDSATTTTSTTTNTTITTTTTAAQLVQTNGIEL